MNQLVQELIKDLLEQMNQDYTIYFDIDDTLTNYSKRLKTMMIDDPETGENRPIKASDTVDNLEFWSSAEWLPGAKEMVDFAKNNFDKVEILSAVPELSKAKQAETGERFWNAPIVGKEDWLKRNVGDIKTNWVRSGSQKAAFARPNTILIDDKPENIRAFQKAGGIGILYTNPADVIAELQYLKDQPVQEAIVGDEIVCDNCGWHWPIADGGDDLYICHKCGYDNTPVNEAEGESDPSINRNNIPGWSFKDYLKSFLKYATQHMNIQPLPRLILINNDAENAKEMLGMTGYYDPSNKAVTLFTLNRHPKDVLRTLAHELVHHEQNLEDRLDHSQTTDTNKDSKLSSIEDEAYLKGSRIFRHWEDQLKEPMNEHTINTHKYSYSLTLTEHLYNTVNEITLNPSNAAEIYGNLTNGKFQVGDIIYVYDIAQVKNPYDDGGDFYNIMFHPKDNKTSIPQQGKENYIKILNTMYKVILDFTEEAEPEYVGIASLDNNDTKNYHKVYANLTDNKFNNIPGYFRKDVSLGFDTPQGKGRFVVLKRKDV